MDTPAKEIVLPQDPTELNSTADNQESTEQAADKTTHRFQADLDKAQSAVSVGGSLSSFSSFIHGMVLLGSIIFTFKLLKSGADVVVLAPFLLGILGVSISWAIVYALLIIVVTNPLTAKHSIYQSSKIKE
ncbi:hypothetical protein CXF80_08235 [Shewanella sp. Actino-trap-3]|jgi:hypothetical protein|uniref:hypothetical protein n=1 Tax=Shewanella sp. Actino-trap-3 TaxID=2058331 RepID=UPI000C34C852|nr:hypothetical protein [Shewanella sp. Actino-trap-3]PKG78303.1 hypothetical protein CXF80_08235 [Shewanella sp. Actino-trap-3]